MPKKKNFAVGLGGLKVVHSNGDQEFAKTRYHASEPGMYAPPEQMVLGHTKDKQAPEPTSTESVVVDPAMQDALDTDLSTRNIKSKTKRSKKQ